MEIWLNTLEDIRTFSKANFSEVPKTYRKSSRQFLFKSYAYSDSY